MAVRRTFYQRHQKALAKFDGILLANPVLERGLVLAPVIVASYNYQNSIVLGLSFACITFATVLLASFIPKRIPYTLRTILYTLIACGVFVPTAMWMSHMFPDSLSKVGVFLPLLVANSLIVVKSESRFYKHRRGYMAVDLLSNCIGFFLVILVVGVLRELLGSGSFFGIPIANWPTASAVLMPFSGFVIVGFLAAAVKRLRFRLENPRPRRHYDDEDEWDAKGGHVNG